MYLCMFIEDCAYVSLRLLKDLQEILDEGGSCHIFALGIIEMKPLHGSLRFSQSREVCGYTANTNWGSSGNLTAPTEMCVCWNNIQTLHPLWSSLCCSHPSSGLSGGEQTAQKVSEMVFNTEVEGSCGSQSNINIYRGQFDRPPWVQHLQFWELGIAERWWKYSDQ